MPCKDCKRKDRQAHVEAVCRVCELVNGDTTIKRVYHCAECKAYICEAHEKDYPARAIAFTKNATEKIGNAIRNIFKISEDAT